MTCRIQVSCRKEPSCALQWAITCMLVLMRLTGPAPINSLSLLVRPDVVAVYFCSQLSWRHLLGRPSRQPWQRGSMNGASLSMVSTASTCRQIWLLTCCLPAWVCKSPVSLILENSNALSVLCAHCGCASKTCWCQSSISSAACLCIYPCSGLLPYDLCIQSTCHAQHTYQQRLSHGTC